MTACPLVLLGGRYRLDDRIGAGGMGEVWRATDVVLDRVVAVKLLRPELGRDDGLARFRAEARSAASVPHPGVAQVYDYCEDDPYGRTYLVMELVDGTSLERLLDGGPLAAGFTMGIIAQAARGLAAAHAAGLVHRDIKPHNLLVTRGGQVKITDFGIARAAGPAPDTGTGMLACTPAYLAPERAIGAPATPAADLYALGIVAYRCLAGRLPFTGEPVAVMLAHRQRPLPPLPPSVPRAVAALVADLTAKDPRARPASAAQVAALAGRLHAALAANAAGPSRGAATLGRKAGAPRPGRPSRTRRRGGRGRPPRRQRRPGPAARAIWAGLALASVAAIALAGWLVAHASRAPAAHQHLSVRAATAGQPGAHPPAGAVRPRDRRFRPPGWANRRQPPAAAPAYPAPAIPAARSASSRAPAPSPSPSPSPTSASPSPSPTSATPSPSPTSATPSPSPTSPTPSPSPTSATPSLSLTPSPSPTSATPSPSVSSLNATGAPTASPSATPSGMPTAWATSPSPSAIPSGASPVEVLVPGGPPPAA